MVDAKCKNYILVQLRRIFKWSEQYREIKKTTRILPYKEVYRCSGCECLIDKKGIDDINSLSEPIFTEDMHIDHIEPVVPLDGFKCFETEVVTRMFPYVEGLMHLCQSCHYLKTTIEAGERARFRKGNI